MLEKLLAILALVIIVLAFAKQLKDDKKKAEEWKAGTERYEEDDPSDSIYH